MKRDNDISKIIKRVYDKIYKKHILNNSIQTLKQGVFIDPGLGSAQAQRITSFIHGYDGNNEDRIISVSDVYCQKLLTLCYIPAKLMVKGGLFKYNDEKKVECTGSYNITKEVLNKVVDECANLLEKKAELLVTGNENISEELINKLDDFADPDTTNSGLKYDVSSWLVEYTIEMLLLHEYSHIYNKDEESADYPKTMKYEKRSDLDAYKWLISDEENICAYVGALCLQCSGLFLNKILESINHPPVDERIKYICELFPKKGVEANILRDVLELFIRLWSIRNDRIESFSSLRESLSSFKLLEYLQKERKEQSNNIYEAGKAENAAKAFTMNKL